MMGKKGDMVVVVVVCWNMWPYQNNATDEDDEDEEVG